MNSKDIYLKKFNELLEVEQKAGDFYKYYITRVEDPILLEQFKNICADEEKHMAIVNNIIKTLDK